MRHPLCAMTIATTRKELWHEGVAKGQDLFCIRCKQRAWKDKQDLLIMCDTCNQALSRTKFDEENRQLWRAGAQLPVICRGCQNKHGKTRNEHLAMIFCSGRLCQKKVPENHFIEKELVEWQLHGQLYLAKCARCKVNEQEPPPTDTTKCYKCKRQKNIVEYPAVQIKEWLTPRSTIRQWACFECLFPPCIVCTARPDFAVPHNAIHTGSYWCTRCKFPPCSAGCGTPRPEKTKNHVQVMPDWVCPACATEETKTKKKCSQCKRMLLRTAFDTRDDRHIKDSCRECEHPLCDSCKKVRSKDVVLKKQLKDGKWHCNNCRQCDECKLWKRTVDDEGNPVEFGRKGAGHIYPRCLACQYPTCALCKVQPNPATAIAVLPHNKLKDGRWFCRKTADCERHRKAAL